MRRLADRFAKAAGACCSLATLHALVRDACAELGFRYFALLHHAALIDGSRALVRLDNYPTDWQLEIETAGLAPHDPVHFAARHSGAPFCWDRIDRLVVLDARQRSVLQRSHAFGLGNGFTVPVNVIGEPAGSCSFALDRSTDMPSARLDSAALVGIEAFRAARALAMPDRPARRTHLSPRQAECLRLLADGKTDWEIALILGLRPETVRNYVKRARAAYDVVSRAQLVRPSLADAWIDF